MNHCPPAQNGLLEPVAVQIAARHKSPQTADSQGLVKLRKVLYRTPVSSFHYLAFCPEPVTTALRHSGASRRLHRATRLPLGQQESRRLSAVAWRQPSSRPSVQPSPALSRQRLSWRRVAVGPWPP